MTTQYSYAQFLEWTKANGKPPRPIGRFETDPPKLDPKAPQETAENARQRIIGEIGPDAFDALPNAPATS